MGFVAIIAFSMILIIVSKLYQSKSDNDTANVSSSIIITE